MRVCVVVSVTGHLYHIHTTRLVPRPIEYAPVDPGGRYTARGLGVVVGGGTTAAASSPLRSGVAGRSGKTPGAAGRNCASKREGPSSNLAS